MNELTGVSQAKLQFPHWDFVEVGPPHDHLLWASMVVHVRDNQTGEVRQYADHGLFEPEDGHIHLFIWTDGNYSCDCNRKLFFGRAAGHEFPHGELACGEGRYSVNLENPKTHEIFYREYE